MASNRPAPAIWNSRTTGVRYPPTRLRLMLGLVAIATTSTAAGGRTGAPRATAATDGHRDVHVHAELLVPVDRAEQVIAAGLESNREVGLLTGRQGRGRRVGQARPGDRQRVRRLAVVGHGERVGARR